MFLVKWSYLGLPVYPITYVDFKCTVVAQGSQSSFCRSCCTSEIMRQCNCLWIEELPLYVEVEIILLDFLVMFLFDAISVRTLLRSRPFDYVKRSSRTGEKDKIE
jgi:hypothetical protein